MSKFKIGDRVRCIKLNGGEVRVGDIGVCVGEGLFDFPNHKHWWDRVGSHVELVTKGGAKVARRTFRQLRETVDTKKGALWQEACDDGTQEYILLDYSYHKGSVSTGTNYPDRNLVEDQPEWFIEVFQVEPQYMTREELDRWEAFKASRPAKAKATPKPDTSVPTTTGPKYSGISDERIAKFVRAYNGSRSTKAVAEKMKIGHSTVYSYKHVAVKRGHTLKTMKRVRAAKKVA